MTLGRRAVGWGLLALVLTSASSGRAQTALEEAGHSLVRPPVWEVAAGVRTMFIKDPAYDPFSDDDALSQFSLTASRALLRAGNLALVGGVGLDLGGSSATARGAPSSLTLTRVSAVAEGRYQPSSRLYLFARLAPGLLHGSATIDDPASPTASGLSGSFNSLSLDISGGGAFCFGDIGRLHVGAWLVADGGYGWVASEPLVLAPPLGADQNKAGTLDLGTLAAGGGFFRIAVALSY